MGDGELFLPLDLAAPGDLPAPIPGPVVAALSSRFVPPAAPVDESPLRQVLDDLRERTAQASREHAALLRKVLAVLRHCEDASTDPPVATEEAESPAHEDAQYVLAQALHATIGYAAHLLAEARTATERFPRTFALLETGRLPVRWHQRLLRVSVGMGEASLAALDALVSRWDVPGMGETRFRRRLSLEVRRLRDRERTEDPEPPLPERSVHTETPDQEDGTACLVVRGPAPEILALGHRLDAVARAVRTAQGHALAQSEDAAIPFDDGSVGETGAPLSLARLRYEVLTRSMLVTDGVEVPEERFRMTVTVPVTTLLGVGDEPGLLDGRVPLPAAMARQLAAGEDAWYRVLTDPVHGTFLPVPADRYRPTPAMLEHLRLRDAVCAVPECGRPVRHGTEADHIEEFDHRDPDRGGRTEVENLHLLCRRHHQRKTEGALDPRRVPAPAASGRPPDDRASHPPGRTTWTRGLGDDLDPVTHVDETDLMTPHAIQQLHRAWDLHLDMLERRRVAAEEKASGSVRPDWGPPPF
ncbi:HNH endonuclease signature motif containing protein [Brachybacterium squillarum]|uniref:HNH endonuclease signature motif containing protein n=1 Tax=Brachybacterium squillarum TaxID=661979 RepID=UPI0002629946|nr:HNH endonuclease signature motif containing protein [Brachybacterium squillarum]